MLADPLYIFAIIGSSLSVAVFFLNQTGRLSTKNIWYDGANAVGAAFLLAFALRDEIWPFVITNTVWFLVSFVDVVRWVLRRLFR